MRKTKADSRPSSSTTGRELSLWSQMMSLASLRVIPSFPVISFSRGVMKEDTGVEGSIRLTR